MAEYCPHPIGHWYELFVACPSTPEKLLLMLLTSNCEMVQLAPPVVVRLAIPTMYRFPLTELVHGIVISRKPDRAEEFAVPLNV